MIRRRSNGTTNPGPAPSTSKRPTIVDGAALEDADDAAFGPAVGDALDARDDAVAVHGLIQVAAGDVDVAADVVHRPVRHDEAEPARMGRDPPDDQVHAIGQAVAVAAGLDQVARARPGPSAGASASAAARAGIFRRCRSSRGVAGCSTLSRISLEQLSRGSYLLVQSCTLNGVRPRRRACRRARSTGV